MDNKDIYKSYAAALQQVGWDRAGMPYEARRYSTVMGSIVNPSKAIEVINELCSEHEITYAIGLTYRIYDNGRFERSFMESYLISDEGETMQLSSISLRGYLDPDKRLEEIAAAKRALIAIDWNMAVDGVFSGDCLTYQDLKDERHEMYDTVESAGDCDAE